MIINELSEANWNLHQQIGSLHKRVKRLEQLLKRRFNLEDEKNVEVTQPRETSTSKIRPKPTNKKKKLRKQSDASALGTSLNV